MKTSSKFNKVLIIGGGLSGLSAAEEILKQLPSTEVIVLEGMEEVGGRTCSRTINQAKFDLGGTWIGRTQKYAQNLAERAGNELIPQFHQGMKILDLNKKVFTYKSNIPYDVGILGLLHMQFNLWKLDRMANKIDPLFPRNHELSFKWDSQTLRSWMDRNIYFYKVKLLIQCAVRAVLGAQTDEVSFLFFLWYIRQNGGVENLINIQNGLQQRKMTKGAQELSFFLKRQIEKRGGKIITSCFVKKVVKQDNNYFIQDDKGNKYEADSIIIAMPPARINKIQFQPQLSRERRYICQRNMMGSCSKVLFLYDQPYWRENGFSGQTLSDCLQSPIFNAYDDTRYKQNGQIQPAIVVFMNGSVDRQWSQNRNQAQKIIVETLATYFKSEKMLNPLSIHWKVWNQEKTLNGAPVAFFPPGALTKIDNIRAPEGRIHWAGTQMARTSQGFMDGAIESGLRAAAEVVEQFKKAERQGETPTEIMPKPSSKWYQRIINNSKKWIQWL